MNRTLRETCLRCNVPLPPEGEAAAVQASSALSAAARLRAADLGDSGSFPRCLSGGQGCTPGHDVHAASAWVWDV